MRFSRALAPIFLVIPALTAQTGDPNYRALRDAAPAESFLIENVELSRDVAKFTLRSGALTFLAPVEDKRMLAVFRGEATFDLAPVTDLDQKALAHLTGKDKASVTFQRMLLAFSDSTYDEIKKNAKAGALDQEAARILGDIRKKIRKTTNDNADAELLADLYNPKREPSFSAYMAGGAADDLRFFLKPAGAIPELMSPEEVGVYMDVPGNDK